MYYFRAQQNVIDASVFFSYKKILKQFFNKVAHKMTITLLKTKEKKFAKLQT